MSTKVSINFGVDETSGMTVHLYEECLEPDDFPVFLELSGVKEVSIEVADNGNRVTVAIPRGLAKKLGLLPPEQHHTEVTAIP